MKPARFAHLILVFLTLAGSAPLLAQETILYNFQGNNVGGSDGIGPNALVADAAGNLYGTTELGGSSQQGVDCCGIIFELSPGAPGQPYTETVLYHFTGGADGAQPSAGLAFDSAGNLYGTAQVGGQFATHYCSLGGCGVVFQLAPPSQSGGTWTFTTLYAFLGGLDGETPWSNVIFDRTGNLYGTTHDGGNSNGGYGCGIVYELSPPAHPGGAWTEQVLYRFNGTTRGGASYAGLVFDKAGALYGTTQSGGKDYQGVVFRLSPPSKPKGRWRQTVLHRFNAAHSKDGAHPFASLIFDSAGNLYGTTVQGGTVPDGSGTVFELSPPSGSGKSWTERLLYSFACQSDGCQPYAPLTFDAMGNLYGTAFIAGGGFGSPDCGSLGCGSVFKLAPGQGGAWTETTIHDFSGPDGDHLLSGILIWPDGSLYLSTAGGGPSLDGNVIRIVP